MTTAHVTRPNQPPTRSDRNAGFGVVAGLGAEILAPLAREVASLGFGSFWANDGGRAEADGLADLATARASALHLELGVGVLPLDRRSPARIADEVRRLDMPLDRLWLGVGSGGAARPLAIVRAGITDLRRLLPDARILVGGLGPRMLRLAGELADGVLLNWIVPSRVPWARGQVAAGAIVAGRDPDTIEVWAYVRGAVGPDARARIGQEAERYGTSGAYGRAFAAMGVPFDEVGISGDDLTERVESYKAVLDGVVVRALPAGPALDDLLAIARAAAPRR
jgi:alkanesulfonate monooxygenase SsuD/methylene tetrahydromethanopterin reductase-like flavin-dependent oxidoreductase (luciferase family)